MPMALRFSVVLFIFSGLVFAKSPFSLSPKRVSQGQVTVLRVKAVDGALPTDIKAQFGEQQIPFWTCGDSKKPSLCGLVAIPLDTPLGKAEIEVQAQHMDKTIQEKLSLHVLKGKFRINLLTVAPQLTRPSEEDQKQIDRDKEDIAAAYANPGSAPLWKDLFKLPTSGGVTSLFGNQRRYNGEVKSTHYGVDLRANEKTPIYASNDGKVLLARSFFYGGNMVLLDHGMNLYSSYAHLSKIEVTPGQEVKRGDKLGMAGATGRVTGPHLHWGTRLNGHPVDPNQFVTTVNQTFPSSARQASKKTVSSTNGYQ